MSLLRAGCSHAPCFRECGKLPARRLSGRAPCSRLDQCIFTVCYATHDGHLTQTMSRWSTSPPCTWRSRLYFHCLLRDTRRAPDADHVELVNVPVMLVAFLSGSSSRERHENSTSGRLRRHVAANSSDNEQVLTSPLSRQLVSVAGEAIQSSGVCAATIVRVLDRAGLTAGPDLARARRN